MYKGKSIAAAAANGNRWASAEAPEICDEEEPYAHNTHEARTQREKSEPSDAFDERPH